MKKFNQLKSVLTDEFSVLNKESLMLVLGGQAHTVAAQGSCGSSRSSQSCGQYCCVQLHVSYYYHTTKTEPTKHQPLMEL